MGKDFDIHLDTTVDATPGQIWQALTTAQGLTTWFIGRTTIAGDTIHTTFGDIALPPSHITTSEAPHHFAHTSDTAPDGRRLAYEYLIEGNDHSATVLRTVTSGFLPGDDWTDEYEAMRHGTELFHATLVEHLRHFPGRHATPITTFGPDATWETLRTKAAQLGGHTYFTNPHTHAIRTPTALYRFLRVFGGGLMTAHTVYDPQPHDTAEYWTDFLKDLR